MKHLLFLALMTALCCVSFAAEKNDKKSEQRPEPPVHAIYDLAHSFTFYGDGRFAQQYLPGEKWARNLASFKVLDLENSNANVLVLFPPDQRVPFTSEDLNEVKAFLKRGGCVLLLIEDDAALGPFKRAFGIESQKQAQGQLQASALLKQIAPEASEPFQMHRKGRFFKLTRGTMNLVWKTLVSYDNPAKNVAAAQAKVGKGTLICMARGLVSEMPDNSDKARNAAYWTPLLRHSATLKVDPKEKVKGRNFAEQDFTSTISGLTFHYNSYLKPTYEAMRDVVVQAMPLIEARMGVPLHAENGSEIALLATDGGGFSAGKLVALAVFWENFPAERKGMYEFVTHELVHSWVHPFTEVWNEPIATYVGDLVMCDAGFPEEGMRRINNTINNAKRFDPDFTKFDLNGKSGQDGVADLENGKNEVHWGKSFWVWETLRKENPTVLADYFRAKRRLAVPGKIKAYTWDETVAVISVAMKCDMFDFFNIHGMRCDRSKATIDYKAELPVTDDR